MSDTAGHVDPSIGPSIGLLEFGSIAAGIAAGDAMVKSSPVSSLFAGTVHPGHYLVLVGGGPEEVEIALENGGDDTVMDSLFLADVHPAVTSAIMTRDVGAVHLDDALGIIETSTAATAIVAADTGVKTADVSLIALRLSDELGGKGYCLFAGTVANVEAAVEDAILRTEHRERLVGTQVIAQLHPEMRASLAAELRFNHGLRRDDGGS